MYNVVFEYNETAGAMYGNRTWTSYMNKKQYESRASIMTKETPIAFGVTEEEALDLTSLTPEICRLMGAIEIAYQENPTADAEYINIHLTNAKFAIKHDRERIARVGLQRIDAQKYTDHFRQMIEADPDSLKSLLMRVSLTTIRGFDGRVTTL